jgi:predicted nucleic acid-binding protein
VEPLTLDASVLIALLDRADAHHARTVDDVEAADNAGRRLIAPASAYSETLVAFARHGRMADATKAIAAMGIEIAPLTAEIAERAAALRARHRSLRLPDAMVLATADTAGLLTYDARLRRLASSA